MDEKLMPCPFCRSFRIVAGREGELFKITCSDCGGSICAPEPNARQRATVWWDSPLEDSARASGYAAGIADAADVAVEHRAILERMAENQRSDDAVAILKAAAGVARGIETDIRALSTSEKGEAR